MNKQAEEKFNKIKNIIEEHLEKYIEVKYPENIYKSMRYSLLLPGKRLRPVIAAETALIFGAELEEIMPSACALEMLHCQSLIHDDLPCMDNDDFRRGKPSNHKVFGEACAVLAGDAFLSFAPEIIIDKTPKSIGSGKILRILKEFFDAAGVNGIISGQIADLEAENKQVSKETIEFIDEYKTAKLFKAAVRIGGITAGVSDETLQKLTLFAGYFGCAFQIYDDILDVTADFKSIGKTPGKDAKSGKASYTAVYGLKKAKEQTLFLCSLAYGILEENNIQSDILKGIVQNIEAGVKKCC